VSRKLPDRLADDALAELWARAWQRLARRGAKPWREASIEVPVDDDRTRHAVAGLLGRHVRLGTARVSVPLDLLDQRIAAPGDGWDLVAVVEGLLGPLPDRAGDAVRKDADIADALDRARTVADGRDEVLAWLDALEPATLGRLHGRGELDLLPVAARTLATLPSPGTPLPVLARRCTGDTKSLHGTALARLVLGGIAHRFGTTVPVGATGRRSLWARVGVVEDDLASQVLVLNLVAEVGSSTRGLADAAAAGLPVRLTLQQLQHAAVLASRPGVVSVCENPAVVRVASEELGAGCGTLVCTEGRPSVACLTLLRSLATQGYDVRVHADFDWAGVGIATQVIEVTDGRPWRFGSTDHAAAVAALDAAPHHDPQPLRGRPIEAAWDPQLSDQMAAHGAVIYEEDVLDVLLADLHRPPRG
jgi:uncharacterized protein (TIGR02679 family)